jgi:HlyD family secretion protein
VRPGEYAPAGVLAAPLVRMGDVSRLHVRVEVDEENAARIRPDSKAEGLFRGDTATRIPLTFVRFEPYVRAKQNLAVAGQRVDTRVLQIIYALPEAASDRFVGQQMDVFVDEATTTGKGA